MTFQSKHVRIIFFLGFMKSGMAAEHKFFTMSQLFKQAGNKRDKRTNKQTHPPAGPERSRCYNCLRSSLHTQPHSHTRMHPRRQAHTAHARSCTHAWWSPECVAFKTLYQMCLSPSCSLFFSSPPFTVCKAPHTEPTVAGAEFIKREEGGWDRGGGAREVGWVMLQWR